MIEGRHAANTPEPAPHSLCAHASDVAAYLDGELEARACAQFERHLKHCAACSSSLREQRRVLCVLDVAFDGGRRTLDLPANFTEVVAARARADMNGVRGGAERRRALWLCAGLAFLSFLLLGGRTGELFAPVGRAARATGAALDMFFRSVVEAGAASAMMLRVLGGQLTGAPGPVRVALYLALASSLALLFRLISNYHRAHVRD